MQSKAYQSIPQLASNIIGNHNYRFTCSAAVSDASITILDILGVVGSVATTTTSTTNICQSFRINKISIWGPGSLTGSTVSVNFPGGVNSVSKEFSDTTINSAECAHVSCKPPKNSLASFWQVNGVVTRLFLLTAPLGSIIDLNLTTILNDNDPLITSTVTGPASIGTLYYLALNHTTTKTIRPVSLLTIQ